MSKRSARRNAHLSRAQSRAEIEDERAFERAIPHLSTPLHGNGHPSQAAGQAHTALAEFPAPQTTHEAVARVGEIIERAAVTPSKQPRFSNQNASGIFTSVYGWVNSLNEPDARADTRTWDAFFCNLVTEVGAEPHLAGVFASIVSIDKNRHYTVTGGRNQVNRTLAVLQEADDGNGWRAYAGWQSQAFWSTRMGAVTECGRDGLGGPLRALWSVDPTRCELTGDVSAPLKYYAPSGGTQSWFAEDYFRAASMGSTNEKKHGLGFPFVARALDLAKIMIAVWDHDKEQLGARAPKGLLLLKGISQEQWENAMAAREEKLDSLERRYYGGVAVLAGMGPDEVSAELMALSQLPKEFNLEQWVSMYMYGLALCAGYDPREFYPVSSGALGTSSETDAQHRKASSKGALDFTLAHQEQLQNQLPATILFEYDQRDAEGDMVEVGLQKAKAELIKVMAEWESGGQSVLNASQIMQLAAQQGVIPAEWTPEEENVTGDDTAPEVDETLAQERVRRAIERFPDEPLVKYASRTGRTRVLCERGGDALKRRSFPVARTLTDRERLRRETLRFVYHHSPIVTRTVESAVADFRDSLTDAIDAFFDGGSLRVGDIREIVSVGIYRAYTQALKEGGIAEDEIEPDEFTAMDALTQAQVSYVGEFVKAIRAAKGDKDAEDAIRARVDIWTRSVAAAGQAGLASAKKNEMVTWKLGETEEHCSTCLRLNNQRHRRSWFDGKGYVPRQPGSETLECGGWKCDCSLETD